MSDLYDFLNQMSPEERKQFYISAQQLAKERTQGVQQAKEARKAELESMSIDDIDQELTQMTPRDNPQRYHELTTARGQKLTEQTAQDNTTKMNRGDWFELNYQRQVISDELNELVRSPNRDIKRVRELQAKLAELATPDPDLITEPSEAE